MKQMSIWEFINTTDGFIKANGGGGDNSAAPPTPEEFQAMIERFG